MRGAGYARTFNDVRRSSIPSRRPCLARASTSACMLALSVPGSASSIWVQRAYGTVSTTTLSVLCLLRWARYVYGRSVVGGADYAASGQRGLVLGLVGTVGSLVGARSTAGVLPAGRLLRRRWIRRGRRSRLRSLLLRRHVDEVDEDSARVNAGSGSHNLDAPYLARQRCRGFLGSPSTYGDGAPSRFGGGRRSREERIEARHAGFFFTQLRSSPER